MKKKTIKSLNFKKETVSILNSKEQSQIMGGITTSYPSKCTGIACCGSTMVCELERETVIDTVIRPMKELKNH